MPRQNNFPSNRTTIEDVARRANVSTATVSRVLNNKGTVSENTTKRVYEAISALNYVAHGGARGLASRVTKTLGFITPAVGTFFFSALLRGINRCVHDHGYTLLLYVTLEQASIKYGNPLPVGEHNTDGILIFTDYVDDESIRHWYNRGLPLVGLHRSPLNGLPIPCVTFENKKGARELVDHLLRLGRRRIAFLTGPTGNEDSYWREVGYRDALADYGIPVDPALVGYGGFTDSVAERQVQQWIDQGLEFDAVFAGDDNAAVGTITVLRKNGIAVPEEVAVVGFNDDYMARHLTPPLTTVAAPAEQSGYVATQHLLRLIAGEDPPLLTLLETQVKLRESCGRNLVPTT